MLQRKVIYKNLKTGYEFGVGEGERYLAASVIKLPLYLHILSQSVAGKLDMSEELIITAEDKVPICGALTLFSGDVTVDIRTLCHLMISISDNTATNKLIDRCGIEQLQEAFKEMGLYKTILTRKMFDREKAQQGLQNYICPKEIGMLLEQLYHGTFVNGAVCKEAMDILLQQQVDHKLNGKLCNAVPVAHKTGEDDNLSNDVGIVLAEEPFILCFAGHDTDVYQWEYLMRRATYDLYAVQKK